MEKLRAEALGKDWDRKIERSILAAKQEGHPRECMEAKEVASEMAKENYRAE
jgi:hypothetical protein